MLNNDINTIIDSKHKPGDYSVLLNTSLMKNGTYFYRLETNGEVFTKKMHIIK